MKDLIEYISTIGLVGARYIEENIDLQYQALKELSFYLPPTKFLTLIVKNALISYQLTSTGEKYWKEFSDFFKYNPEKSIEEFLVNSKGNKRLHNVKLNRLKLLEKVEFDIDYYKNMEVLRKKLENILQTTGKTIYFAVKMYGYGARILTKKFIPYPYSIPIPYDLRLSKLSEYLNIKKEDWEKISIVSKVPPLHIDSILWPLLSKNSLIINKYKEKFYIPKFLSFLIN